MSDSDLDVPPGYANDLFDLTGRVAVVTGGGSGLGRAISIGYAQVGVTVSLPTSTAKAPTRRSRRSPNRAA